MSNKKKVMILFILAIISVIALIISILNINNDDKERKLKIKINKEEKIVNTIDFTINPGDEISYKIVTDANTNIKANVYIWFTGVNEELKDILNVYAKYNTYQTKINSITEYTSMNKLSFKVDLDKKNNSFDLIFEMPSEVGNHNQNKDYNFDTYIKVEG